MAIAMMYAGVHFVFAVLFASQSAVVVESKNTFGNVWD